MDDLKFLMLALKAQESYAKATHIDDENALRGKFCVLDMLDMLGKEIDKEKTDVS